MDDLSNRLTVNYSGERKILWVFLTPGLIILLLTNIFPIVYAWYLSFFSYPKAIPTAIQRFIGIKNYITLVQEANFLNSLKVTFIFVSITIFFELLIGILLALLVTENIKGMKYLRVFFLIPMMIAPVVAGIVWRALYNSLYGPFNYFIGLMGLTRVEFLGSYTLAPYSVMVTEIWMQTPFVIFVIAAGIQALPIDIYKSASVDGAGRWQVFKYITMPLIKPVLFVVLLIRIIDAFRVFDTIYIMTYGGPGVLTETVTLYIYRTGFYFWNLPGASVMSFIMLGITTVFVTIYMRVIFRYQI